LKPSSRIKTGCEFHGNIPDVRAVEDCIRSTRKYKEYLGRRPQHPVQGQEFPSESFSKRYEVYPEMEISMDMQVVDAVMWIAGSTPFIDVWFRYDYRSNKATVEMLDGPDSVRPLLDAIPGLRESLRKIANGNRPIL